MPDVCTAVLGSKKEGAYGTCSGRMKTPEGIHLLSDFSGSCSLCDEELLRKHEGTWSLGLCENICRNCEINALTEQGCAGNTSTICFWQWIQ